MYELIINEFSKLRGVRSSWLLLLAAQAVIIAGVSGVMARGQAQLNELGSRAVGHVGLVSLFALVLGITAVAGEYRHRTISDTYMSTPRRGRVVAAKIVAYVNAGVAFGIVSAVVATATTAIWLAVKGGSLDLASSDLWRTLLGGIAWDAAFAAIGVGLGSLIRNLTGGIVAAFAWLALIEGVASQLLGDAGKWLPFRSGSALANMQGMADGGAMLSQWQGGLALALYATAFIIIAVSFTIRRDVT